MSSEVSVAVCLRVAVAVNGIIPIAVIVQGSRNLHGFVLHGLCGWVACDGFELGDE